MNLFRQCLYEYWYHYIICQEVLLSCLLYFHWISLIWNILFIAFEWSSPSDTISSDFKYLSFFNHIWNSRVSLTTDTNLTTNLMLINGALSLPAVLFLFLDHKSVNKHEFITGKYKMYTLANLSVAFSDLTHIVPWHVTFTLTSAILIYTCYHMWNHDKWCLGKH